MRRAYSSERSSEELDSLSERDTPSVMGTTIHRASQEGSESVNASGISGHVDTSNPDGQNAGSNVVRAASQDTDATNEVLKTNRGVAQIAGGLLSAHSANFQRFNAEDGLSLTPRAPIWSRSVVRYIHRVGDGATLLERSRIERVVRRTRRGDFVNGRYR